LKRIVDDAGNVRIVDSSIPRQRDAKIIWTDITDSRKSAWPIGKDSEEAALSRLPVSRRLSVVREYCKKRSRTSNGCCRQVQCY
jgi:hypothetical protein